MTPRYVTARRGTLEFERLIKGSFSSKERALPIQSLRIGKSDEEVTFELVSIDKVPQMGWLQVLKSFLQMKKLLFVLFPLFFFIMRDWERPYLSVAELVSILAAILLALLSVQMKVDSEDFISGYDRVRGSRGQKVLSQGIRTVSQLQRLSQTALVAAVAVGLLPLLVEPLRILSLIIGGLFLFLGYKIGVDKKDRFVRDVFLALIAGPCLAFGIVPQLSSLAFGIVWAFFVFFELQIEHFRFYFAQAEAGERNLLTIKSFDLAPKILWGLWGLALIVYVIYRSLQSQMALWFGALLILIVLSLSWRKNLFQLSSPAGSAIDRVCEKGHQLYLAFITLWVAEILFQAMVAPLVFVWFK